MTPAERLLAAADLLDKRANDDLTPAPWTVKFDCPDGEHHHDWDEVWIAGQHRSTVASLNERYTCAPRDAAYIATMHPEVGKAVASWMRRTAETVGHEVPRLQDTGVELDWHGWGSAAAVADLVLAGESQ